MKLAIEFMYPGYLDIKRLLEMNWQISRRKLIAMDKREAIVNSGHMALCHMTQLTNQNWRTTMVVVNDAQLSKILTVSVLQKGYLYLLFRPQLFTVLLSPLFCQYILHRKQMEYKISIHHLFVYF